MNPDYEHMVRCRLFIFNAVQASSPTNRLCQRLKINTVRLNAATGGHAIIEFAPAAEAANPTFAGALMFAVTYLAQNLFPLVGVSILAGMQNFILEEMLGFYREQRRFVGQMAFCFEQPLGDGYELETEYRATEDPLNETALDFAEKVLVARLARLVELLDEYYFIPAQGLGFSLFPTDLGDLAETHERTVGRI